MGGLSRPPPQILVHHPFRPQRFLGENVGAQWEFALPVGEETEWLRFHAPQPPGNSHCAPTDDLEEALGKTAGIVYSRPSLLAATVASRLAEGQIVAWFQGRSEYGPRALGNRSILADPRRAEMKEVVNARIKHREPFRPFAGTVPIEHAAEYFELTGPSPFMQFVVPIRKEALEKIPAISHGGTCRVQTVKEEENPAFHELLIGFRKVTSIPILLNTSFNDADEPIVCSPSDAIRTFLKTNLDGLALGPFLVSRSGSV